MRLLDERSCTAGLVQHGLPLAVGALDQLLPLALRRLDDLLRLSPCFTLRLLQNQVGLVSSGMKDLLRRLAGVLTDRVRFLPRRDQRLADQAMILLVLLDLASSCLILASSSAI